MNQCSCKSLSEERSKHSRSLLRHIDFYLWVDPKDITQATGVVTVPMRDYYKIQFFEVNVQGLHVSGKNFRIVSRIKEDCLARMFNQGRETPILLQRAGIAESVIQNRDFVACLGEAEKCHAREHPKTNCSHSFFSI